MRSPTRLVSLTGWFALRPVGFAALALVVLALAGGVPPHAEAQEKDILTVQFSPDTLPIGINAKGESILCQGQKYKIYAQAVFSDELQGSALLDKFYIASGTTNHVDPQRVSIRAHEPAATFIYDAKNKGSDALTFEAHYVASTRTGLIGTRTLAVEVQECTYKVTFIHQYQFAQG